MNIVKEFLPNHLTKVWDCLLGVTFFYIDEYELHGIVLYHIVSENGDAEDMIETEYRDCIEFYRKSEIVEINEM